jgi:DNA repair exonuclease SbcCD ATPase subunit
MATNLSLTYDEEDQDIILDNSNSKVNKILHISDIHIRKDEGRHQEYRHVFTKLYNIIEKNKKDSVLVITGDILNERINNSGLQIELLKEFIINLTKFLDVIIIIGDHDTDIYDPTAKSVVEQILFNTITEHNFYILNENRRYIYKNIVFGVTNIFAKRVTRIFNYKKKITVALYHGGLNTILKYKENSTTNKGLFSIEDFKDYKYKLFGDIHNRGRTGSANNYATYAGSLIQQANDEDPFTKGVHIIDLINKIDDYIDIFNDYSVVNIEIVKGNIVNNNLNKLNKNNKIIFNFKNTDTKKHQEIIKNILDKTNAQYAGLFDLEPLDVKINNTKINKIFSIKSNKEVKKIILDYISKLEDYKKCSNQVTSKIEEILDNKLKEINYDFINNKNIILEKLEFDNTFCYGKNNIINFKSMKNIYNIYNNQGEGKSSLFRTIIYALYGELLNTDNYDIVNVNCKEAKTCITFRYGNNNILYKITRIRKSKNSPTNTYETVLIEENSKEKRMATRDANEYIKNLLPDINIFIHIYFNLQDNTPAFYNLSPLEQQKLLFNIFKLDVFTKLKSLLKSDLSNSTALKNKIMKTKDGTVTNTRTKTKTKQIKGKIKEDKTEDELIYNKLENLKLELEKVVLELNNNKNILENIEKEKKDISELLILENNKIYNISEEKINFYQELVIQKNNLTNNINNLLNKKNNLQQELLHLENKITILNQDINNFNNILERQEDFLLEKNKRILEIKEEIKILNCNTNAKYNIDFLNKELINIQNKILELTRKFNNNLLENNRLCNKNKNITFVHSIYDKYNQVLVKENNNNILEQDLCSLNSQMKILLKNNLELTNIKINKRCKTCMSNNFIKLQTDSNIKINNLMKEQLLKIQDINILYKNLEEDLEIKYNYEMNSRNIKLVDKNIIKINLLTDENKIISKDIIILNKELENINNNIQDYYKIQKINNLNKEMIDLENANLEDYITYQEISNTLEHTNKNKNNINLELNKINENISNKYELLSHINTQLLEYQDYNNIIAYKDSIYNNIKKYNNDINKLNKNIEKEKENIYNLTKKEGMLISDIEQETKYLEMYLQEKVNYSALKILNQAFIETKKNNQETANGIFDVIIQEKIITDFENKLNSLLKILSKMSVKLIYKSGKIKFAIYKNNKYCGTMPSQGEENIINTCARLILAKYNTSNSLNFAVIDERGFTYLDETHLNKMPEFFNYLRKIYDFTFIVSHIYEIKNLADKIIIITEDENKYKHIEI